MADEFTTPDLNAPLELAARIAAVPATASVKGMFLQSIAEAARAASGKTAGRGKWLAFKDYPYQEWLGLLVECAELAHPRVAPREGMRRLGQGAYDTFVNSTIGRVVMSVAGSSLPLALRQVPRIYSLSGTVGTAEVSAVTDVSAMVHLRGVWDFVDAWHVGVYEGGMRAFRRQGAVRVRLLSMCDADLELTWR